MKSRGDARRLGLRVTSTVSIPLTGAPVVWIAPGSKVHVPRSGEVQTEWLSPVSPGSRRV